MTNTARKPKLCVIDDDMIYTMTVKKLIEHYGLCEEPITFKNGQEAIDYLKENTDNDSNVPDIIFLDLNMPVLDGWGFLDEYKDILKALKKTVKVYISSSSVNELDISKAKSYPYVSDYLVKPPTLPMLQQIIAAY